VHLSIMNILGQNVLVGVTMRGLNMQAINYKAKPVCCCHLLENSREGSLQH